LLGIDDLVRVPQTNCYTSFKFC